METVYRTTIKGIKYYSALGDPMSALGDPISALGESMRQTMTERDWAMEQICVQLNCEDGVSIEGLKECFRPHHETDPPCFTIIIDHTDELITERIYHKTRPKQIYITCC